MIDSLRLWLPQYIDIQCDHRAWFNGNKLAVLVSCIISGCLAGSYPGWLGCCWFVDRRTSDAMGGQAITWENMGGSRGSRRGNIGGSSNCRQGSFGVVRGSFEGLGSGRSQWRGGACGKGHGTWDDRPIQHQPTNQPAPSTCHSDQSSHQSTPHSLAITRHPPNVPNNQPLMRTNQTNGQTKQRTPNVQPTNQRPLLRATQTECTHAPPHPNLPANQQPARQPTNQSKQTPKPTTANILICEHVQP